MSSNKNNSTVKLLAATVFGAALGAGILYAISGADPSGSEQAAPAENEPLYWVAPMDANYRRDKPGKSPMGMDLVPVYADDASKQSSRDDAVQIAPHVVNNLGVRTAPVELKTMDVEISTVGYVQYDEDNLIHIHPRVEGWIEKLFVKAAGNPVEKGQPLYTLYAPQLVNAQEELLIALKRNNNSLITAAKDRLKALQLSPQFISELEASGKVKQTITFYSPQAGVVDGLKIREGFFVKPGNTLLSIGKLDQVWVEAEVFARDSAIIKQGLPVSMTLDYLPGKEWVGVVDYVYPTLNSKTRTLRVRLKFDNPDYQLKPNMFAQVTIHAHQPNEVLLVPKEAVIRTGKQDRVVQALGEGNFKSVEVIIGRVDADSIEILDGLEQGDMVVTSAQFLIDSESSKSSDLKRMTDHSAHGEMSHSGEDEVMDDAGVSQATVSGVIIAVDSNNGVLTIAREAIEKWNRPAATMDFQVAQGIALTDFAAGDEVIFTFKVTHDFVITDISHAQHQNDAEHAHH